MKRDISVFGSDFYKKSFDVVIGTHSGIFHMDEVIATALLCLFNDENAKIAILRTRDASLLKDCTITVDVGGGKFDHHQVGGNGTRKNGIPYASAGLIWQEFGEEIIAKIAEEAEFIITDIQIDGICTKIDTDYIQTVDAVDNGYSDEPTMFEYITAFLPDWNYSCNITMDRAFEEVLTITISILHKIIRKAIEETYSFAWLFKALRKPHNEILELPAQTFPWLESITAYNVCHTDTIDFVIFPYPTGGWAAQSVPPSAERTFEQRVPFPKSWAGQTTKLPEISGVSDATFCHNNCFFVRANTKKAILQMCEIALHRSIAID